MGTKVEKERRETRGGKLNKSDYMCLVEEVKRGLAKHPELLKRETPGLNSEALRWRANF